jgi:hypothetical protein
MTEVKIAKIVNKTLNNGQRLAAAQTRGTRKRRKMITFAKDAGSRISWPIGFRFTASRYEPMKMRALGRT